MPEMTDTEIKIRNYDLISDALAARQVVNEHLVNFKNLITEEYINKFCNDETKLNNVEPLKKLWALNEKLNRIANCPEIYNKTIGAIGGGFSSGKSSFINSFFTSDKIRLAEGIKPVTAIPSYIIRADTTSINGFSYKGGVFPISLDLYKTISHEMLKSFKFNLKDILHYITVFAPLQSELFSKICLTDTPGYNPPNAGNEKTDMETAKNYIANADFLIWLVGLDANGTIPLEALDFLTELNFGIDGGKPLYIVANKAELKPLDDIKNILSEIEESLDDYDLQAAGICAYSSKLKKIMHTIGQGLFDFIKANNVGSHSYGPFVKLLNEAFRDYIRHIHNDHDEMEIRRREAKKLLFKALEEGHILADDTSNSFEEGLNNLIQYFEPKQNKSDRLEKLSDLHGKFLDCLNGFCDSVGIARRQLRICPTCGTVLDDGEDVCGFCSTHTSGTKKVCASCGHELVMEARFCTECGKRTWS